MTTLVVPKDLVVAIEIEGLEYAVTSYYGKDIECDDDRKMEKLWKRVYKAIRRLEKHIEKQYPEGSEGFEE